MRTSLSFLALTVLLSVTVSCSKKSSPMLGTTSPQSHVAAGSDRLLLTTVSDDPTYGFEESNPVMVGGAMESGPSNERAFLNSLAGPDGQDIRYVRLGSCCPFKSKNGFDGTGLLDKYEIVWDGQKEPLIIFINMYDKEDLKAPVGLTIRQLE